MNQPVTGSLHHVELWVPHHAAYLANTDGFEVELVARAA